MNRFVSLRRLTALALALLALAAIPSLASADPLIKLKGEGTLSIDDEGLGTVRIIGQGSHLGQFTCVGEVLFRRNNPEDGMRNNPEDGMVNGVGVVAFRAANGDMLVGVIAWHMKADGTGEMTFLWRDDVTFSNGTTVDSSGRFAKKRPPGATVRTQITQATDYILNIDGFLSSINLAGGD